MVEFIINKKKDELIKCFLKTIISSFILIFFYLKFENFIEIALILSK